MFNLNRRFPLFVMRTHIALGVCLLLLTSCGSKETTYIKAGGFTYYDQDVIMPRTVIMHTRVAGIQVDYSEQTKFPNVRFGLIDIMWVTDVKSATIKIWSYFSVPWLAVSSNYYDIVPSVYVSTNEYVPSDPVGMVEMLERELEITFDPGAIAIP